MPLPSVRAFSRVHKITFEIKSIAFIRSEEKGKQKSPKERSTYISMLLTSIARGGVVGDRHDGRGSGGQTGNARVAFCYRKVLHERKKRILDYRLFGVRLTAN